MYVGTNAITLAPGCVSSSFSCFFFLCMFFYLCVGTKRLKLVYVRVNRNFSSHVCSLFINGLSWDRRGVQSSTVRHHPPILMQGVQDGAEIFIFSEAVLSSESNILSKIYFSTLPVNKHEWWHWCGVKWTVPSLESVRIGSFDVGAGWFPIRIQTLQMSLGRVSLVHRWIGQCFVKVYAIRPWVASNVCGIWDVSGCSNSCVSMFSPMSSFTYLLDLNSYWNGENWSLLYYWWFGERRRCSYNPDIFNCNEQHYSISMPFK